LIERKERNTVFMGLTQSSLVLAVRRLAAAGS
jgi:hypothetical protein